MIADGVALVRSIDRTLGPHVAAAADGGNLAWSPLSIAAALAMTRVGASGRGADELDGLLGVPDERLDAAVAAIDECVEHLVAAPFRSKGEPPPITIRRADALWGQAGLRFAPTFLDRLAAAHGAGLRTVDYRADPEAARATINAWVGEQTHGRIPDLLPPNAITRESTLTLTDALYLAAAWMVRFRTDADADGRGFTTLDGRTVEPSWMVQTVWTLASGPGWIATSVPYVGGALACTFVVPDVGRFAAVADAFLAGDLDEAIADAGDHFARLTLPLFGIDHAVEITGLLRSIGVHTAFDDPAGLVGVTADPARDPVQIETVVHRATVDVDRNGTEASAATALMVAAGRGPTQPPEPIVVDRPFLFRIEDTTSGLVFFSGQVTDPTQSTAPAPWPGS